MPLYEYECPQCGRFEVIQKFSEGALGACPTCGQSVQKLLSAPAFQFKGSGWYVTDYARKSGANAGESSSAGASSEAAKPAASSTPAASPTTGASSPSSSD